MLTGSAVIELQSQDRRGSSPLEAAERRHPRKVSSSPLAECARLCDGKRQALPYPAGGGMRRQEVVTTGYEPLFMSQVPLFLTSEVSL